MLFPPLLEPPKSGRVDTSYCNLAFVASDLCACTGARTAAQQTAARAMNSGWLTRLVMNRVVILCPLLNFHDHTLGIGLRPAPEPLRTFRTSHFISNSWFD